MSSMAKNNNKKKKYVVKNEKEASRTAYENFLKQHNEQVKTRSNLSKGAIYLALSIVVIYGLTVLFPSAFNVNIREFMKSASMVGLLRIVLGVFMLACLIYSLRRVVKTFTLEDETWVQGLMNVLKSHMIGADFITIVLTLFGGLALIIWGACEILG